MYNGNNQYWGTFKVPLEFSSTVRNAQPQQAGTSEDDPWFIRNQQLPDNGRESDKAAAAERGSCRIERRRFAPADDALQGGAFLLLGFVFFD
jgi:hypothetical protein